jgi:hypothetical protein
MRQPRPERSLIEAADRLAGIIAPNYTEAVQHLTKEAHLLDGFGMRGGDQLNVTGGGASWLVAADAHGGVETIPVTTVERAAAARLEIHNMTLELEYRKACVLLALRELNKLATKAKRHKAPKLVQQPKSKDGLCCSNQAGKAGAIEEWGDALCMDVGDPRHGGLCYGHYMKWYRYRKAIGVDTSKDFEPA